MQLDDLEKLAAALTRSATDLTPPVHDNGDAADLEALLPRLTGVAACTVPGAEFAGLTVLDPQVA